MLDNRENDHHTIVEHQARMNPAEFSSGQLTTLKRTFGALNSSVRLQLVLLLSKREHYVNEMVSYLHESQPLISQHLQVLKAAHIVTSRRNGQQTIYQLADVHIFDVINLALDFSRDHQLIESPLKRR